MILYQLPISIYSFKVRLALALKGVRAELREPPGGTYRSAEYRAIVPAATVPALVDGDLLLTESDAIIEYIDEMHPPALLLRGDPARRARARMLSRYNDFHLEPHLRALFPHVPPAGREPAVVAERVDRIGKALALIETALDPDGPFALGDAPSLADCAFPSTLMWLDLVLPVLGASPQYGPRLARLRAAMAGVDALQPLIATYPPLVHAWIDKRLQG